MFLFLLWLLFLLLIAREILWRYDSRLIFMMGIGCQLGLKFRWSRATVARVGSPEKRDKYKTLGRSGTDQLC